MSFSSIQGDQGIQGKLYCAGVGAQSSVRLRSGRTLGADRREELVNHAGAKAIEQNRISEEEREAARATAEYWQGIECNGQNDFQRGRRVGCNPCSRGPLRGVLAITSVVVGFVEVYNMLKNPSIISIGRVILFTQLTTAALKI